MINLLRTELFKLSKNKIFWTLILIATVVFALLHILITIGWWKMDNLYMEAGLELFSSLPLATAPFYFMLFLSTFAGFFVANDFTIGVVKNIVMSGNRRSHIFLAKFIVLVLGSVMLTVACPLIVITGGKLLFGFGEMTDPSALGFLARGMGLFLIHMLACVALLMLIALLAEDSGKTIIISVVIALLISVAEVLRPLPGILDALYRYSIFHHLIDSFRMVMTAPDMIQSLSVGLGTLLIVMWCGNLAFKRKEIK
ncbi:ABC-2 type transport system permease protein [Paenibacillus rhizosphaerae]|uniref:ABC-2 type transport system permease protein n=1 Tax=Paenibacillus rhizosphaerae TaxID=297318 RepID=A0A839TSE4_9BACL|nr:ABC transporter permease [Paenibacillus rhizosphaerae]MBB3129994.1 ABC-2 type transport system permease protein [Paenibacillus rhizosphaerae]